MLGNDTWLERQLASEQSESTDLEKLIRLEQFKKSHAQVGISKVQDGWEKEFYTREEAQAKLSKHREAIARADSEIARLRHQIANRGLGSAEVEHLRQELKALCERNLCQSTFEEKVDLIAKLGLRVLPTEDLKSRKILCRLNINEVNGEREQDGFAKVTFGGAEGIRTIGIIN